MISFSISTVGSSNGPAIFGSRLKGGLEGHGWRFDSKNPDVNIVFASGEYLKGKINILRLDNLYFDNKNTIGNTYKLNEPIKDAYYKFDKIVFQSEFARKQYFNQFSVVKSRPCKVIYNGVPEMFSSRVYRKIKYPFDKTFICSADWRKHKRLASIIEAFKYFNQQDNVGLVVLGNVKEKDKVIHKNIKYVGKIHHTELPFFIRGADAGIHLSWLDCSPNVVYEFLACGLPVLCSDNGGTKEIVRENGIVLKLENTYQYNKVDLYHPPEPDVGIVYQGMKNILRSPPVVGRNDLYIDKVSRSYIDFIVN